MAKNVYGKKKTTRNILIGVIAVLVIAAAIFLIVALQKDGAGMNCFQRNATAVSADGVKASVAEYRVMYDMVASNYANSTLTDENIRSLQEYTARQVLMMKVYEKEAKALGLTLTEEQITESEKSADDQIASIEQYYADSMIQSGSYSKAALDKQLDNHYQQLGMSKSAYRAFVLQSIQSDYYRQALEAYYAENGSGKWLMENLGKNPTDSSGNVQVTVKLPPDARRMALEVWSYTNASGKLDIDTVELVSAVTQAK